MKLRDTLKFKLMLILSLVALTPIIALSAFQLNQFSSTISRNIKSQKIEIAASKSEQISSWVNSKTLQLTGILKAHPEFSKIGTSEINAVLKPVKESDPELDNAVGIDKDGMGIVVTDNSLMDLSEREYFQQAKATKKIFITDVLTSKVTGNRVITIAVPILDGADFHGVIFSQVNVSALGNYTNNVKVEKTGYAFILSKTGNFIFHPDSEMIDKSYEEDALNPEKLSAFKDEILAKDSGYITYSDDDGVEKIATYSTVAETGWKVVVTVPSSEVYADLNHAKLVTFILIIIAMLMVIGISTLVTGAIATPIKLSAIHLDHLADSDFTRDVPAKFLNRKDEIGMLVKSIDVMSKSIRAVLHEVIVETGGVKENAINSVNNLAELANQIEDVSATTQEMSAGMEETAASTEQMNASSTEIESAVEFIAEKAKNGSVIVEEISKRAQDLKNNAVISQKTARDISLIIDQDMRASIEQSKAVEKINMLTESILQITSQTNLLALNAAIEAARAGEAGKGFAVVADEIRKLAEDSKNTVNEIQNVTKLVVTSVESLTQSSEKALNFIDTTVITDYTSMVSTGEQYYKDAESIQELVAEFSETAGALSVSIQNMSRAINEVSVANIEGARGTQNIAERASDVMMKAKVVTDLMEATENKSISLAQVVSKFKI